MWIVRRACLGDVGEVQVATTVLCCIITTSPPVRLRHKHHSCCSTLTAEPHGPVALGLQQDHGWRSGADRRELTKTAEFGFVVVPADHRRGSGVHRLRLEPAGGIDARQVGTGMLGDVWKCREARQREREATGTKISQEGGEGKKQLRG